MLRFLYAVLVHLGHAKHEEVAFGLRDDELLDVLVALLAGVDHGIEGFERLISITAALGVDVPQFERFVGRC
jgi:hypothetical protein